MPDDEAADKVAQAEKAAVDGARAGRGFRYQDAVAASLAVLAHVEAAPWSVLPEGNEDISLTVGDSRTYEIQAKSRRAQKRDLTAADAVRFLAETWARHVYRLPEEDVRVCLVLDRQPTGCAASGFAAALAEQADLPTNRLPELAETVGLTVSDLLQRSHLILSTSPAAFATEILVARLGLVPIGAEVLFRQVLARVVQLADERAAGREPGPLTPNEVARIIEEGQRIIDVATIERPLREGICEYVNFEDPIEDPAFYLGVDVVAGHIPAGLVAERPDEVEQCLSTLERAGQAIVTGPSGIGKTAIAYLAADTTKHTIRWLRVQEPGSAFEILKLTEALRATRAAPVGLLMDDIGRIDASMWDALVRRARDHDGVYLLGTTREEDLDLIEEAAESTVLRPRLDEDLAKSIWRHLTHEGVTTAPSWVEALDQSDGLTLEFVHYLTTGRRLPETIARQVQLRRKEHRDDELRLLRVVSLAAASSAAIDLRRFASVHDLTDEAVQRALRRLLDEHLVRRTGPNELGGLHRLRSEALLEATHQTPPPSLSETAALAIQCASTGDLPVLLADLWVRGLIETSSAHEALNKRLRRNPGPVEMARCLDGLRTVSVRQHAIQAKAIMDGHEVPAAFRRTAVSMAMLRDHGIDSALKPTLARALPRLRDLELQELRGDWIDQLPGDLVEASALPTSTEDGCVLLRSMAGLATHSALATAVAQSTPPPTDVRSIAEFVDAGRLVGPAVADACVTAVGGSGEIVDLARHQPWVSHLQVHDEPGTDSGSERVIEFHLMCVEGGLEDNIHDAVVGVTELFFALFPDADVIAGKAVDASGQPAGYRGHQVADKRIPRSNMPSSTEVRWNRALLNEFAEAGLESRTERLVAETELLQRAVHVTGQVAERWVRGAQMSSPQRRELKDIAREAHSVWRRERTPPDSTGSDDTQVDIGDLASALDLLCGNALLRLFADPSMSLASFLVNPVHRDLDKTVGVGYWRLLDADHDSDVLTLASTVSDLHQILGLRLRNDRESPAIRAARRSEAPPVAETARLAREAHEEHLADNIAGLIEEIGRSGFTATAFRFEPQETQSLIWPPDDIIITVEGDSLYAWLASAVDLARAAERRLDPVRNVTLVPSRGGRLIPSMALRTLTGPDGAPFPGVEEAGRLVDEDSTPVLAGTVVPAFIRAIALEATKSGLERLGAFRPLLTEEADVLSAAEQEHDQLVETVIEKAEADASGLIGELIGEFLRAAGSDDVAATLSAISRGEADEAMGVLGVLQATEIELSIDPQAAQDDWQQFLATLEDDPGIEDEEEPPSDDGASQIPKVPRNQPCPCGSGKKYKLCHSR